MLIEYLAKAFWIAEVVVGLGLLIFLHELGHFLMAKKNKVRVEVFSLGFGQAIFKRRYGETEYRVSWIPLGGYVKMAGETLTDERKGEPWELTSKGAWARFQIFTAGAIMNLIIAFPIATLAFIVGRYETTNEIGVPGTAEAWAGVKPGDVVVEAGGRKIESLDKFRTEMVRRSAGDTVTVKVLRDGREETLSVRTMSSAYHMTKPVSLQIDKVTPGSDLAVQQVQSGDEIISIDGKRVFSAWQIRESLQKSAGKTLRLGIRRKGQEAMEVSVDIRPREFYAVPQDDGIMECIVGGGDEGRPATGKLMPGDRIVAAGDAPIRSWKDLKQAVEPAVEEERFGKPLKFVVKRDSEKGDVEVEITPAFGETGKGAIGISPKETNVFADVPEGSYFHKAGVRSGDILRSVDGAAGPDKTVASLFKIRSSEKKDVTIEVKRAGETRKFLLTPEKQIEGDLAVLGLETEKGMLPTGLSQSFRRRDLKEALAAGFYEPIDIGIMTFEVLKKLVTGGESTKGLSGPVGISRASYKMAQLSLGNFLWLLCLITVNLGIFNLLPVPILDGGHVVLLLIEKLRGRPPSEQFVAGFQYVGLALILGLVIFVTYNDITGLVRGG